MNINKTNPRLATRLKLGEAAAGKIVAVKPGILPITEGPSKTPPMTSAMTRGCRILDSGQCKSRQNMIMIPAYRIVSDLT